MTRRALVAGDDYPGGPQLSGCRNDAVHMTRFLRETAGFDEVTVLLNQDCTKANIEQELDRLVSELTGRDLGVFYDSGHGTEGSISLTPGAPAVKHEGIVPFDYKTAGIIWDEHLRAKLAQVDDDARMLMVMDTCFSGGLYRFAPTLSDHYRRVRYLPPEEWLRPADIEAEVGRLLDAEAENLTGDYTPARQFVLDQIAAVAGQRVDKAYPVLLLAATQPGQVAWCADIDGVAQGAFTYALLEVLNGRGRAGKAQRKPRTYVELMYGAKDLEGVVTARANRPGLLPSADLAGQNPTLWGTPGRVRWDVLAA
jgi:hypothetical protein